MSVEQKKKDEIRRNGGPVGTGGSKAVGVGGNDLAPSLQEGQLYWNGKGVKKAPDTSGGVKTGRVGEKRGVIGG